MNDGEINDNVVRLHKLALSTQGSRERIQVLTLHCNWATIFLCWAAQENPQHEET